MLRSGARDYRYRRCTSVGYQRVLDTDNSN